MEEEAVEEKKKGRRGRRFFLGFRTLGLVFDLIRFRFGDYFGYQRIFLYF